MTTASQFHVGDRVQTTQPLAGLPLGSVGTIGKVFPIDEFYGVRFAGELLPRLIHCSALAPVPTALRAREVGTEDG